VDILANGLHRRMVSHRARFRLALAIVVMVAVVAFMFASRFPIVEPPASTTVTALFPDDIIGVYGPDDHGWWEYTMRRDSDRDPQELCDEIHAAMVERFPLAIPGIGVRIVDSRAIPPYRFASCGMPDWW
jgi:hypothetical protein